MSFSVSINPNWFMSVPTPTRANSIPTGDLNSNIEVTLFPDWYKQISLEWKVPSSWAGAKFHVYFWPGGNEAYTRLTTTPTDNQFFSDKTTREYSKAQQGFYVVEALLPSGQKVKSIPESWEYKRRDRVEKIANESQRREYMLLSKFVGAKSFLFRKKTYGLRCHRCWNRELEKVMDDHCEVCYGTSFEGGYYDPIPIFVQYDPISTGKQKTYIGNIEPSTVGGWTISMPVIASDDVIIRSQTWSTFKVINVGGTELQTTVVRQMLSLSHLSKGDVENLLAKKIQREDSDDYLDQVKSEFAKDRFPRTLLDKNPNNDYAWAKDQSLPNLPKYEV